MPGSKLITTFAIVGTLFSFANALPVSQTPAQIPLPAWTSNSLIWQNCTEEALKGIQCANFSVPLDWSQPDGTGERINLLITRLPASGPADEKIGSLIVNPGGPGGSAAISVANYAKNASYINAELRRRFDLIGPDPRGIGFSTPLQCNGTIWNPRASRMPQNEQQFDALVKHNRDVGNSCRNISGNLIDFMDTASAAKDIEAIRVALGNEPLNYLGFSYGTQLGMAYAELFPQNIRAMIIDGILDHFQTETSMYVTEASTFEDTLNRFFDWCKDSTSCALHDRKDIPGAWDELIRNATANPIPAPDCDKECRKDVTAEELIFAVDGTILRRSRPGQPDVGWISVSKNIALAMEGNATALSEPIWYPEMTPFEANTLWGQFGVVCQDWFHSSKSVADTLYKNQLANLIAPHSRGVSQSYNLQLQCLGWPAKITNPPHFSNIRNTPNPILMVNAYHDPSTSYTWAIGGREQIENAVLLSRDGDSHTSYGLAGEASHMMDEYLLTLKVPKQNTVVMT